MSYTPEIAEVSKDAVYQLIQPNINKLVNAGVSTVHNTIYYILLGTFVFILLLITILLIYLVVLDFIKIRTGVILGILGLFFIIIVAIVLARSIEIYSKRKLRLIGNILGSFINSQRLLDIIDESAGVYYKSIS